MEIVHPNSHLIADSNKIIMGLKEVIQNKECWIKSPITKNLPTCQIDRAQMVGNTYSVMITRLDGSTVVVLVTAKQLERILASNKEVSDYLTVCNEIIGSNPNSNYPKEIFSALFFLVIQSQERTDIILRYKINERWVAFISRERKIGFYSVKPLSLDELAELDRSFFSFCKFYGLIT